MRATSAFTASASLAKLTSTLKPSRARRSAIAAPIPRDAPVTMAVFVRDGLMVCLNRDSPDGGLSHAEIAAAADVFQAGSVSGSPIARLLGGGAALHPSFSCARPCVVMVSYGAERERGD